MKLLYDQIYMKKFRSAPQYSRLQTSLEGDALLPQTCTYWQPFGTAWLATVGVPLRHVKLFRISSIFMNTIENGLIKSQFRVTE